MPVLSAPVVVLWLSLIFAPVVSGLFAWSGSGHRPRRRTDARQGTPPWSVPRCTRAAARDVYGRAAHRMRGPPRAHARRTGAAGGGIACGVQARTRPRRDCVSWCWSLAARAAAAASGDRYAAGVVIESRASGRRSGVRAGALAPQRGEPSRSASTWPPRGESGSSALPFHYPPCAPPPVVRRPCRAASERRGRTGGHETGDAGARLGAGVDVAGGICGRVAARPDPLRLAGELTPRVAGELTPACESLARLGRAASGRRLARPPPR